MTDTQTESGLRPWDAADFLRDPDDMAAYLDATIEEFDADPAAIAHALGAIARARGMSDVAERAGLGRTSLYKALSAEGNPGFATIARVAEVLGLRLTFKVAN